MTKFRLGNVQHGLLCEALRRYECFAVRRDGHKWTPDDLLRAWTGLGTRSEYRPVIDAGLMKLASCTAPGCIGWWSLTEAGAQIVLAWHEAGFGCGNGYELKDTPPKQSSHVGHHSLSQFPNYRLLPGVSQMTDKKSQPRIVNLAELTGRVEIEPDYHVELPDTDQFIIVAGANYPAAATQYDHPNVAARQDKVFYTRAYWPDGRKKWFQHAGRDFYFVIPRNRISLVFEKGYSYVPVIINGQTFRLSVTGGTFNGWTDFVSQKAHIGINATRKVLDLLAEVAVPPLDAKVPFQLEAHSDNDAASFVELVAGHLCRSRLQEGHRLVLCDGWSYDGSRGPFSVASKLKGRQCYVAINGHGSFRATYKSIDWTKTAAENGFVVEGPVQENRIGPITPCDSE